MSINAVRIFFFSNAVYMSFILQSEYKTVVQCRISAFKNTLIIDIWPQTKNGYTCCNYKFVQNLLNSPKLLAKYCPKKVQILSKIFQTFFQNWQKFSKIEQIFRKSAKYWPNIVQNWPNIVQNWPNNST